MFTITHERWPQAKHLSCNIPGLCSAVVSKEIVKLHYYTEGYLHPSIVQGCKYMHDLEIWASLKAHSLYPKTFQFVQKNKYLID